MKLEFAPAAREDLDAIRRWIARDDRDLAISFTRKLVAKIGGLRTAFARYPEVDSAVHPGLRRMNYRNYRVFYTVSGDGIDVLHVHHGSRATPPFD